MAEGFDAIIVGAGIIGAACALEFAEAGVRVAVIEPGRPGGSGATAASMGHIVVMDDSEPQMTLTRYGQKLWQALVRSEPERHAYRQCGTIWIATSAEEMWEAQQKHAHYQACGIASEILAASKLYQLEPELRPGLPGGLLVPDDAVVYPPHSTTVLLERARERGAALLAGRVVALESEGVVLADRQYVRGGTVVVANGAQANELLPELPILPRKGHLALIDSAADLVQHQLVELGYIKKAHAAHGTSVSFNVQQRSSGQLLVGTSRQFSASVAEIDHDVLNEMLALARAYLPGLAGRAYTRILTGLRAATPDGLPLIGPHPDRMGVWLATGHEGLGITTALATARLLVAQFLARETEIPGTPYLPARILSS